MYLETNAKNLVCKPEYGGLSSFDCDMCNLAVFHYAIHQEGIVAWGTDFPLGGVSVRRKLAVLNRHTTSTARLFN